MRYVILGLIAVMVLWSASVASAECAWVLWQRLSIEGTQLGVGKQWTAESAYPAHTECTAVRDRTFIDVVAGLQAQPDTKVVNTNPSIAIVAYTVQGTSHVVNYTCFPDTIDPREKKE